MTSPIRVSLVDFVNAWPLTWGFLKGTVEGVESITDIPSACADRLNPWAYRLTGTGRTTLIVPVEAAGETWIKCGTGGWTKAKLTPAPV